MPPAPLYEPTVKRVHHRRRCHHCAALGQQHDAACRIIDRLHQQVACLRHDRDEARRERNEARQDLALARLEVAELRKEVARSQPAAKVLALM